jgi:hypothetical protein
MDYLFGPVLSRRLGLSMGVDLLSSRPAMDCVMRASGLMPNQCREKVRPAGRF